MTDKEKMLRDINGLKDSIRQSWLDLVKLELTAEDRAALRKGINALTADLTNLLGRL